MCGCASVPVAGFDFLIFAVIVAGRHRHQECFHSAFALAPQNPQPLEEFAEILVDAMAIVGRLQEEIMEPRDRETQR